MPEEVVGAPLWATLQREQIERLAEIIRCLAKDYAFDEYRGVTQPKHELLYRMVTGDKNALSRAVRSCEESRAAGAEKRRG